MADSPKASVDYAPAAPSTRRRFQPRLWPTLAALLLVPLFIAAGQWQWNKAAAKASLQAELEARGADAVLSIPTTRVDAESLRYRKLVARGRFEAQYQVLIDNRTHRGQAGYHVVTPLRLEGSDMRVLVNRGWIPLLGDRATLPQIATPTGMIAVAGTAIVPRTSFFTLGKDDAEGSWQSVWQNLDLARYGRAVSFSTQPVVLQLDANSPAGFLREWPRPDDRRQTNRGYALQWWSFAATTVVLWLLLNFRRPA